jgi:hypothetical protein
MPVRLRCESGWNVVVDDRETAPGCVIAGDLVQRERVKEQNGSP